VRSGLEKLEDRRLLAGLAIVESLDLTTVSEAGMTDTFTVALTARPDSDVVLRVTSVDVTEVTVDPSVLVFTPDNWSTPQTVTVAGVDDWRIDGPQAALLTVSVDNWLSDPAFYMLERTVNATNRDDDFASLQVSKTSATVSESGTTDAFTVVLSAQPDFNVELSVTSDDTGEVTVSPIWLTFTPADWNLPQTVTLTGVDDAWIDGSQSSDVAVTVDSDTSDFHFAYLAESIGVTTMDDDVAGFTVSPAAVIVSEGGTSDEFAVVLTARPNADVVLNVSSADAGEATVSPGVLTFAPEAWNVPQTVTVTGVDDPDRDGSQVTAVTVGVEAAGSDGQFSGVGSQTVSVTTIDDDMNWQNPGNAFDANGDGSINAADALVIINYINTHSGDGTLPPPPAEPPPYYDVNGDGLCGAIDVLLVINWINTHGLPHTSDAEGEDASRAASSGPVESSAALSSEAYPLPATRSAAVSASALPQEADGLWIPIPPNRLAQPGLELRRRTADAVFRAWPDNSDLGDELADSLAPDLGRVVLGA